MAEVKVLIEGYAKKDKGVELVTCTTTLIKDNGKKIIVDPGMNKSMLIKALKSEGIAFDDIDYVILTHTHTDHVLLTALFQSAEVIDPWSIFTYEGKCVDHEENIPDLSLKLIRTPGHDPFHICVVVGTQDRGKVIVAGDVFWWANGENQNIDSHSLINKEDPYMKNREDLVASREKILKIADWIIPGHGKMFKVEK
ncbi:MAG: MBL fold metallo-hydrolase [Candidatus Aenigmatarchaeota archaeon]